MQMINEVWFHFAFVDSVQKFKEGFFCSVNIACIGPGTNQIEASVSIGLDPFWLIGLVHPSKELFGGFGPFETIFSGMTGHEDIVRYSVGFKRDIALSCTLL